MALTRDFFEVMPKSELHLHMDGALPEAKLFELAQTSNIELPGIPEQSLEALEAFYRDARKKDFSTVDGFNAFLRMFAPPLALMQTREGLRDFASAHVEDLARQNYVYAETRFAPQYSREKGLTLEEAIQSVLDGIQIGQRETATRVKLIVSIGRECDQETSLAVAKAALNFQDDGVVALDLACNEIEFPPELHLRSFQHTFGSRLRRTVHAGELAKTPEKRAENILTAVNLMEADGLGHAIPLVHDQAILERVARGGIRIESCPLSNLATGAIPRTLDRNADLRSLELKQLLMRRVNVSINTDDPLMFGTSWAEVMDATVQANGLYERHVQQLLRNAVDSAFCSESEKGKFFDEFRRRRFSLTS